MLGVEKGKEKEWRKGTEEQMEKARNCWAMDRLSI